MRPAATRPGTAGRPGTSRSSSETGECQHNNNESVVGWRWQCEGEVFASIEFDAPLNKNCQDILGDYCSEHHVFGPSNDTYEAPDVMACCGEYDPLYKDTFLQYCNYDLIQQACVSMAKRLEDAIKKGRFGIYSGQAAALQVWVAQNYSLCFDELVQNNSSATAGALATYWQVPNSQDWHDLDNLVISINTGTESTGVFQPVDPEDWLSCHGTIDNNGEIFEGPAAPSGSTIYGVDLASSATGSLSGPVILGGAVTAYPTFNVSCASKGCSASEFWLESTGKFTVGDIAFYNDGFTVSNGNGTSFVVDSARITLYDYAPTQAVRDSTGGLLGYKVTAGSASFLLSAESAGISDHYLATNGSDILITEASGTWTMSSFSIQYVDQSSNTWTLSMPATTWD